MEVGRIAAGGSRELLAGVGPGAGFLRLPPGLRSLLRNQAMPSRFASAFRAYQDIAVAAGMGGTSTSASRQPAINMTALLRASHWNKNSGMGNGIDNADLAAAAAAASAQLAVRRPTPKHNQTAKPCTEEMNDRVAVDKKEG